MIPKIIFMDLEGTLLKKAYHLDNGRVAPSAWTLLAESLGEQALEEEEITKDKWNRGEYSGYVEWMEDTIKLHQKYGLNQITFEQVMNSVDFMPGLENTFDQFSKWGSRTAIISGGFKHLCDRVQTKFKITHALCGCEYFFDKDTGYVEHWNLLPADYEGKVDFMRLIMKEHKVDCGQCVFIGDGKNDVAMAKPGGLR